MDVSEALAGLAPAYGLATETNDHGDGYARITAYGAGLDMRAQTQPVRVIAELGRAGLTRCHVFVDSVEEANLISEILAESLTALPPEQRPRVHVDVPEGV